MLGQAISMLLPKVVGYKLVGELDPLHLRSLGVVGKFVEFFGPGVSALSIADRATVANMCPEFGATLAHFPVDERSLQYLYQTSEIIFMFRYKSFTGKKVRFPKKSGNTI
ncbi:hypothetical protein O3G_MSEX013175 [Manduca sexta]|uniref:Aconitase/3-isopropylmalate dehydratase large subunit alpha/beta/alpha domain-containing protein n=1 Tax=Manduca sexta TaxID=7130 RepID=A0A922CXT9_MANSE|nr:hypothetical protein O3G_MSEX013175 [Manduca sexta]